MQDPTECIVDDGVAHGAVTLGSAGVLALTIVLLLRLQCPRARKAFKVT